MYQGKFLPENRETRVVQLRHKRNHTPAAAKEPSAKPSPRTPDAEE